MSYGGLIFDCLLNNIIKRGCSKSGADVLGELGSGAGKGGGGGGTVREAGGGLGKYGAAKEEEYFHNKKQEQLENLNKEMQIKKMQREKRKCGKAEDVVHKNRKLIAILDKCLRKK